MLFLSLAGESRACNGRLGTSGRRPTPLPSPLLELLISRPGVSLHSSLPSSLKVLLKSSFQEGVGVGVSKDLSRSSGLPPSVFFFSSRPEKGEHRDIVTSPNFRDRMAESNMYGRIVPFLKASSKEDVVGASQTLTGDDGKGETSERGRDGGTVWISPNF